MDIIVFRRRLVMPPPTGVSIFTTTRLCHRFSSVATDSCSLYHGFATLSPWWSDFIFIIFGIGKLNCRYFASFAISPAMTSTGASTSQHALSTMMSCYIITTSGFPIFKNSTRTSSTCIFTQVMTTRWQEATVLDSMFSCFPTNQRVGGLHKYKHLKIRQAEAINLSRSHCLHLCFGADVLLQQLQLFHRQFWLLSAAIIYSKILKYQVQDLIYMFGSLELSTNQLGLDELDNNIYFPPSEASTTAVTLSSTVIFVHQEALHQFSLCTRSHQGNFSSFDIFSMVWWIVVTDIITSTFTSSALTSPPLLRGDYVLAVGCFCHHRLSSPTCYFVFTVGLLCNCR